MYAVKIGERIYVLHCFQKKSKSGKKTPKKEIDLIKRRLIIVQELEKAMSKIIKFEESSGNVYADLNLPDAEELYLKATLGFEVFQIIEERKLTQSEAANILGVKQPEISRLKNGKFNHYSVERLLTFLTRLNRDIEICIIPTENRIGEQRVMKEEHKNHHDPDMLNEYDFNEGDRVNMQTKT